MLTLKEFKSKFLNELMDKWQYRLPNVTIDETIEMFVISSGHINIHVLFKELGVRDELLIRRAAERLIAAWKAYVVEKLTQLPKEEAIQFLFKQQ